MFCSNCGAELVNCERCPKCYPQDSNSYCSYDCTTGATEHSHYPYCYLCGNKIKGPEDDYKKLMDHGFTIRVCRKCYDWDYRRIILE